MRIFTWTALTMLTCAGCGGSVDPTGTGGTGSTTAATTTGSGGGSATSSGSTTSASSSSSSSTTSSASTSTGAGGGSMGSGDCTTDAQCPGSKCVEIFAGGFKVCAVAPVPATMCNAPGFDECCGSTMPCPGGLLCDEGPLVPYCGGAQMQPHNQCAKDQCTSDTDCGAGNVCLVSGVLGRKVRSCFAAACKLDAECNAAPGGQCAPVADPCCGQAATLYCVYPGDCRSNGDCNGGYCEIDTAKKRTVCTMKSPPCPA